MQISHRDNFLYKGFIFLGMIYITLMLSANVLIYKLVFVDHFTMSVGSFITPFWFIITDISAEVYGYQMTKKLIWFGFICSFLFTVICALLIHLPSPPSWPHQAAYNQVLGNLPRIFAGSIIGAVTGIFINAYFISKWKILTRGKYFWLRSFSSSGIGLLLFTSTTIIFDLLYTISLQEIIQLIIISMIIKLIVTFITGFPALLTVRFLQKLDNINTYDYSIDFNPFKLELNK